MFGIGIQEFGLILVVALLVFGPKRLPELARMLGRGMGEFRRASNDLRQSLALDDLQNDLRRDLHSAQSLLKPDEDRPAQAGDDVPTSTTALGETSTPARYRPAPDKHQGELPLGNDTEHHAEAAEPGAESASTSTSTSEPEPEPEPESSPASDSDAAVRAADATDSERG